MRAIVLMFVVAGCSEAAEGVDPKTAERAPIDRFSDAAGRVHRRSAEPGLPGVNEAIDYDARFRLTGYGPGGETVEVYDFDGKPAAPAPIYAFFQPGQATPVVGQLNVVTVIPGDPGYNDLWQVVKVSVPEDYVANSVTSYAEILEAGYAMETTSELVNCPVVPEGSVARQRMRGDYAELHQGWYGGKIIQYFHFGEAPLAVAGGLVPVADAWVTYAINPGQPGGGAASGHLTEAGGGRTHDVLGKRPDAAGYSPLWNLHVYDNASFASVHDLATAMAAPAIADEPIVLNAPVIVIE